MVEARTFIRVFGSLEYYNDKKFKFPEKSKGNTRKRELLSLKG